MGNDLKNMASLAKQRLKKGTYTNAERARIKNEMNINSYFIKNLHSLKKLTGNAEFIIINNDEDEIFINKVKTILTNDKNVFNPIGQLIDKKLYNTLNDVQKQFYVLTIVDKFNKIKNELEENKEFKIS